MDIIGPFIGVGVTLVGFLLTLMKQGQVQGAAAERVANIARRLDENIVHDAACSKAIADNSMRIVRLEERHAHLADSHAAAERRAAERREPQP